MIWANGAVLVENIGDYCLGREQDRIETFDSCMRNAKESSDHSSSVITFVIIAIIAAVYIYNRSQSKQGEAVAAENERKRRQAMTPEQRVEEDVAEATTRAVQREQTRADAEELAARRRMWESGTFVPGVPLPPESRHESRPKPQGDAPPGWYDAPPGDGYGLYYRQNYPFQYWDGTRWVETTAPASQHYYWTRRR